MGLLLAGREATYSSKDFVYKKGSLLIILDSKRKIIWRRNSPNIYGSGLAQVWQCLLKIDMSMLWGLLGAYRGRSLQPSSFVS